MQKVAYTTVLQEWLRLACRSDAHPELVRRHLVTFRAMSARLLDYVVNIADGNGNTALHYSVSHANFPVVRQLLDSGESPPGVWGQSPLARPPALTVEILPPPSSLEIASLAAEARPGSRAPARLLTRPLAGVCQVDKQNRAGYSPLMLTALAALRNQEDMETVLQLFRLGNVNAKASQVRAARARGGGGGTRPRFPPRQPLPRLPGGS